MHYRVDQLAARAGVSVDTVRFYQSRGLLPPPRRAGRVVLYADAHLARLRRIRALAAKGLSLSVIRRVLDARRRSKDDALLSAVLKEEERARMYSREEVAAETGVPLPLLSSLEAMGLVEPAGPPGGPARYTEVDLRIIRAGLALLEFGFPMNEILSLAADHDRAVGETVERAIALFDRYVRGPAGSAADARVVDAFRRLLPTATELVANHFQRTLLVHARRRLEKAGDAEGLAALSEAVGGGRAWKS
jgi:DNA-binding transcriptional MerR regulator